MRTVRATLLFLSILTQHPCSYNTSLSLEEREGHLNPRNLKEGVTKYRKAGHKMAHKWSVWCNAQVLQDKCADMQYCWTKSVHNCIHNETSKHIEMKGRTQEWQQMCSWTSQRAEVRGWKPRIRGAYLINTIALARQKCLRTRTKILTNPMIGRTYSCVPIQQTIQLKSINVLKLKQHAQITGEPLV